MGGLLTIGQLLAVFSFFAFSLGVWLGPYLRDWWKGIPAPVRAGMNKIEASLQRIIAIEVDVAIAKLHGAADLPTPVPPAPPSPVVLPPDLSAGTLAGITGPIGPS